MACVRCDDGAVSEQTWRPPPLLRAAYFLSGTLLGALATGGIVSGFVAPDSRPWSFVVAAMTSAGAVGFWLAATRPALTASDDGVTVRGALTTTQVGWTDVIRCVPGYSGIAIVRRDGSVITANAVQKSNYAQAAGRRTRADEVAKAIEARARSFAP